MKELMEMRDKRVQSWNAAKAFLESHRGEDGTLSAEDDAIFNKMMDDVDKLGKEIVRLEKMNITGIPSGKQTQPRLPQRRIWNGTRRSMLKRPPRLRSWYDRSAYC